MLLIISKCEEKTYNSTGDWSEMIIFESILTTFEANVNFEAADEVVNIGSSLILKSSIVLLSVYNSKFYYVSV